MNRAYAVVDIKSIDDKSRTIVGIATSPSPDRVGDIVVPAGVKSAANIPLFLYHDSQKIVGRAKLGKATKNGIPFEATLPSISESGALRDRVEEGWQMVKYGLITGVSIGFRALDDDYERTKEGGRKFNQTEVVELSLVPIPAQPDAVITAFKSLDSEATEKLVELTKSNDRKQLAASGKSAAPVVRLTPAGVTANPLVKKSTPEEGKAMNVQDQVKTLNDQRAVKHTRMTEIQEAASKEGRTKNETEREEFDTLRDELKALDTELVDLKDLEAVQINKATRVVTPPPNGGNRDESVVIDPPANGGGVVVPLPKKLEKGIAFARFAKTMIMADGKAREALDIAKERYPNEVPLHNIIKMHIGQSRSPQFIEKATVDAAITTNAPWAGALVQYQEMADDFIEYLRPQTILGRLQNLRKVPFKVRVPRQTGGGSASWVGEGRGKPVTALAFDNVTLDFTKIATIAVLTDEIVRLSTPSADAITRDSLAGAIIQQMDSDFIDPHNAGTANIKPASITNGVTEIASSGNAEANVRQDILAVFQPWIASNLTPQNAAWIMSPTTALALSLMVNGLGQPSFPNITMNGGSFFGLPVVVSESAGIVGSSAGGQLVVLLNQRDILLADDGTVAVDASREASVEMSDAPTNRSDTGTGASLVSLWQTNSVGIRAERWVNWVKARPTAVQYLHNVHWGQA